METVKRASFGSKIGIILASAGSAVGLGNIWRFPTETGENGGAAFILVYLCCVLLLGMPIMISEFLIGRRSHANTAKAYAVLAPRTPWHLVGRLGVFGAFLILSYYSVVAGWTLDYTVQAIGNRFTRMAAEDPTGAVFANYFQDFVSNPWRPVVCLAVFLFMTHYIIVKGVEKGIERSSKVMMPALFLILIMLVFCSITMPGMSEAARFLFTPDFSKIDSHVILSAMGQAFFSLSLGMGCLCTYASYFKADANLGKTALSVGVIDTFVAVMAGLVIFPAVFSVSSLQPDAGPQLIFVALPNIFQMAFGNFPILGYIFSVSFYVLLILATLTSTISLHEVVTAYLNESFNLSRKASATLVTLGCLVLGILCSLSMGILSDIKFFGMNFFDLFDYVTAKLMLPVGAFFIALFTGWKLKREVVWSELTNDGKLRIKGFGAFLFLLRFFVPIGIGLIFLHELGLMNFL